MTSSQGRPNELHKEHAEVSCELTTTEGYTEEKFHTHTPPTRTQLRVSETLTALWPLVTIKEMNISEVRESLQ